MSYAVRVQIASKNVCEMRWFKCVGKKGRSQSFPNPNGWGLSLQHRAAGIFPPTVQVDALLPFLGFFLSFSWDRVGDLCSVLVGSHCSSHGLTKFYTLWLSLYSFKWKMCTTCQQLNACQWNKKLHYPFRILWMCTAFLTAATRDWNGGA